MWSHLLFYLLVGVTYAEYGWKAGMQYNYNLRGRTVSGLHEAGNQFTGVLIKAKLNIQAKSDSTLSLQIKSAEYSELHANLSNGWDTEISDEFLNYAKLPLHEEPFELYLDDGIIKEMTVDKGLPTWEVNILKSIVSLLQVDTKAENIRDSGLNLLPTSEMSSGVYKTMEDSINGIYETTYDVSILQEYLLQSKPDLIPLAHLRGNGKNFQIVKTRDFSKSKQHMVYHYGIDGQTNWEPGSNTMGNFLTRTSVSNIIISGSLKQFTIQSSVTNEKIIVAPHLYNKQKGMVSSKLNLTLESVTAIKQPFSVVSHPLPMRNLVYEFNPVGVSKEASIEDLKDGFSDSSEISIETQTKNMLHSKIQQFSSSMSASSESESVKLHESYHLPNFDLSEPPHIEINPFYVNENSGKLYEKKIRSFQNVIKLAREITEGIMMPNTMTGKHTLNKFTYFLRILRTMSAQEFKQLSEKLYYPYSKAVRTNKRENALNYLSWTTFRDAVGLAGSGPALITIRDWIVSQKIKGEEAAHLIAKITDSAKHPTQQYLEYFFDVLNDEMVKNQKSLRISAVLTFTDLVRKAVVDRKMMHNYYPIHIFGPISKKSDSLVSEKYIPYFEKELQNAVENKIVQDIQLIIRALNNIAHPQILTVFKPYLEGKIALSKFQRLTIVTSMDKIIKLYPDLTRTVLYRIYQNMAETPEIRVAAVMQLMKTDPPVQMMQQMAEQTNFDQSKQVNSAIKSAIESLARQEENKYNRNIVEKARAAVNLLTSDNYGIQYSRNYIKSHVLKDHNLGYKHHLSYIQGFDSIFPNAIFYNLKTNIGGYKKNLNEIQFMTSSINDLLSQLYDKLFGYRKKLGKVDKTKKTNPKWSLEDIYSAINFETGAKEQLEGAFLAKIFGAQRFLPFGKSTVDNISDLYVELGLNLMTEQNNRYNLSNIYNQEILEIVFPVAMGLPFIYTLETPTLLNMDLQMTGSMHPIQLGDDFAADFENLKIGGTYNFIYSAHKEGKLGFITPHNDRMYFAGLEKNVHVYVPLKMQLDLNKKDNKVYASFEPLEKNIEQKVFEYSTQAYTTMKNVYDINLEVDGYNTKIIRNQPIKRVKQTFGKDSIGLSFEEIQETDNENLEKNMFDNLQAHDIISFISFIDMLDDINNQNYTITFKPKESSLKEFKMSLTYTESKNHQDVLERGKKNLNDRKLKDGSENLAIPSSENKKFQEELMRNVGMEIEDAQMHSLQLQLEFDGAYKSEYELILAYADSYKSNMSRILALLRNFTTSPANNHKDKQEPKKYLVAVQVNSLISNGSLVDFKDPFNKSSRVELNGRVDFGEQIPFKSSVVFNGVLNSSLERRETLRKSPLTILCEKQSKMGYKIQSACRNISRRVHYLDNYYFNISAKNMPNDLKELAYMAYQQLNNLWYDYSSDELIPKKDDENVEIHVKFGKHLLSSNLTVSLPGFENRFQNIPIHDWVRPLIVINQHYGMIERLGHKILAAQYSPVCSVDQDLITTFDNSSYHVNFEKKTYILMQNIPNNHILPTNDNNEAYFSILTHHISSGNMAITVVIGDDVLELIPVNSGFLPTIIYNGQNLTDPTSLTSLKNDDGTIIIKLLALSREALKISAEKHGFTLIYHGNHLIIEISNKMRSQLRGLCGNFDGEEYNDFTTPQNCITRNIEQFVASYGMADHSSLKESNKSQQKTNKNTCYKQINIFPVVINEKEVKIYNQTKKKMSHEEKMKKRFLKEMVDRSNNFM